MPKSGSGWLTPLAVQRQKAAGFYADGGGLYLRVTESLAKYWAFRFSFDGKRREMFLGKFSDMSLAQARDEAIERRRMVAQGLDPINVRLERRASDVAKRIMSAARAVTFKDCAEGYIDAHRDAWRNAKHKQQWENTLAAYAYPVMGDAAVADIDLPLVLKVLEPIWKTRTETAKRLRGRIEVILDWAHARDYRIGENPARWKGKLQTLLAAPSRIMKVRHHPALPYEQIGAFIEAVEQEAGSAALALHFLILTACRTGEVLGAQWQEIDEDKAEWVIPAERMKAHREHRIPLSLDAMEVLAKAKAIRRGHGRTVFPSPRGDSPLSNMALAVLLRRMNMAAITVHGFRSTFRDWCAEMTAFPREIAEACLAHISGDKVEVAYLRTDFMAKRRLLMEAWAKYCATPSVVTGGKVVALRTAGGK